MRILIDMQGDQTGSHYRGIGRFLRELVGALIKGYPSHHFILHFDAAMPASVCRWREHSLARHSNVEIKTGSMPPGIHRRALHREPWRDIVADLYTRAIERAEPDVVLIPSFFESEAVVNLSRLQPRIRRVVLLHDLIPLVNPQDYLDHDPDIKADYLHRLEELKGADQLLCNSAFTAQEAVEWLDVDESSTTPIWADADARFEPRAEGEAEALLDQHGITRPFLLHTGAVDPRKNIDVLIKAFSLLPARIQAQHRLVLAGPIESGERATLQASARRHGVAAEAMVILGHVTDELLVTLYNACSAFVFPSRHEGFGLPALEAMRCGAPVIAANATSLVEVVGDEAALFDPDDPQALATKFECVLTDPGWREERLAHAREQAERFSWARTASLAMDVFERMMAPETSARALAPAATADNSGKPRLAFVSPLPPAHTGIANYSEELLPALARHYDIALVTDQVEVSESLTARFGEPLGPGELRRDAAAFDRILYQVGNSPFHSFMADLLDTVPGAVVLHDAYIGGLWMDEPDAFRAPIDGAGLGVVWAQALRVSHGLDAVAAALAMSREAFIDRFPSSWPVIERSRGVIVHSRHACELVEGDYRDGVTANWHVIPHLRALPERVERDAAREHLGIPPDTFIVATFGMVSPTKRNQTLLQAWSKSALAADNRCQLVFAGPMDGGEYGVALRKQASTGEAGRVRFTDRLTDDAFADWLAAADVAVQLRGESRGETSGAVSHAMARGLPVLVNAHGSMAELPDNAVFKIGDPIDLDELVAALNSLYSDSQGRVSLGQAAEEQIAARHDPDVCATQYAQAIEGCYLSRRPCADSVVDGLDPDAISRLGEADRRRLAVAIAKTLPASKPRQRLLIDVTATAATHRMTGVERVAQRLVESWLAAPPDGFRVEPVQLVEYDECWHYVTAVDWMRRILDSDLAGLGDEVLDPGPGDILGIVDISGQQLVDAVESGLHRQLRADGCKVFAMVHDILPVTHPHCFPPGADETHERWLHSVAGFDAIFATSGTVRRNVTEWLAGNRPDRADTVAIGNFPLGSDHIANSDSDAPDASVLPLPTDRQLWITVGTVEPRKRHAQVLDAFEQRWASGSDDCLVIVGKEGWRELPDSQRRDIPATVKRLRNHPECHQRLFWLDGLTDAELEALYRQAHGLIAASEDEGYGLPVVEAAARDLPVLARDIPVFREVAPAGTRFFTGMDGEALAAAMDAWATGVEPVSGQEAELAPMSWRESAEALWIRLAERLAT